MGEFSFPRLVVFCLLPSSRFFEPMSSGRCLLRPSSSVFSLSSPLLLLHLDQPKVEKEKKEENPTALHSFLLSERCSNVLVGFPLGEDLVEDLRRRLSAVTPSFLSYRLRRIMRRKGMPIEDWRCNR